MIQIILFEDNKHLRENIIQNLENNTDVCLLAAYTDARDAVSLVKKHRPDVVLMDIQMPHISGIEATFNIKKAYPDVKVLIQTVFEDNDKVFEALRQGADGYLVKNADIEPYLKAIKDIYEGGAYFSAGIARKVLSYFSGLTTKNSKKSESDYVELTQREKEVLGLLVEGKSYKMIADACDVQVSTIHSHIKNIYKKLHVNSATEAVSVASKHKWWWS